MANKKLFIQFFILSLVPAALAYFLRSPDFPLDDAYIVQHSVAGLLGLGEIRFHESTPLQGATSPAHVLLILVTSFFTGIPWAQFLMATLYFFLYTFAIYKLCHKNRVEEFWTYLIIFISVVAGFSFYHLFNGLETGLAMAAVLWVLYIFDPPESTTPQKHHFLLLGALPFIRPELAAFSLLFLLSLCISSKPRVNRHQILTAALWSCLGTVPFLAFLHFFNGPLIPNTLNAKIFFFAEGCGPLKSKLDFVASAITGWVSSQGIAALGFAGIFFYKRKVVVLAFIAIFIFFYLIKFPGALHHNWYRYLYLLFPFILLGWIQLLTIHGRMKLVVKLLLLMSVFHTAINSDKAIRYYVDAISFTRNELAPIAEWAAHHLTSQDVVLIHDAGYISTIGKAKLIDLVGLKTPSSVDVHKRYTWELCGRNIKALDVIATKNQANYFIVLDGWDQIFGLTASLRLSGWKLDLLATRANGYGAYKIYRLNKPNKGTNIIN